MFAETGCAGIVIGRAALANPWVFREISAALVGNPLPPPPTLLDRVSLMTRHFLWAVALRGEHLACLQFRKMIDWYARAFGPCKRLRLSLKELSSVEEYHEVVGQFLEERQLIQTLEDSYPPLSI